METMRVLIRVVSEGLPPGGGVPFGWVDMQSDVCADGDDGRVQTGERARRRVGVLDHGGRSHRCNIKIASILAPRYLPNARSGNDGKGFPGDSHPVSGKDLAAHDR